MRNVIYLLLGLVFLLSCGQDQESLSVQGNYALEDILKVPDSLSYVLQAETFHEFAELKELKSGSTVRLNDLNLENKVIAYLSDVQCTSCVDQEITILKKFYKENNLILLANYSSERELKIYLKLNKVEIPVYIIVSTPSELLTRLPFPTYFTLNANFKPSSVFFASVSTPNRSRSYHRLMAEHLKTQFDKNE